MNEKSANEKTNTQETPTFTLSNGSKTSEMRQRKNPYSKTPKTENHQIKEGIQPIDETPFLSFPYNGKYAISLGKFILATGFNTRKDAERKVQGFPWEIMLAAAEVVVTETNKMKNGN